MDHSSDDARPLKRAKLASAQADGSVDDHTSGLGTNQTNLGSTLKMPVNLPGDGASKELEVGIITFIDDARDKFQAILKKRYTDFLVNEILPDGQVVHLQSMNAREAAKQASNDDGVRANDQAGQVQVQESIPHSAHENDTTAEALGNDKGPSSDAALERKGDAQRSEVSDNDRAKLVEYFSEETVQQLTSLYDLILRDPEKKARDLPAVRTPFTTDRSIRTQIHQDIRRIFDSKIESSTDKDGVLVLRAATPSNRNRGWPKPAGKARPGVLSWMDRGGEYLHFTLYKENKDTLEAISFITKQLKTTNRTFQFAGTKDRRAVTVQRVSAYRIEAHRLAGLNRVLRYAAVGDFTYQKKGLELGDLSGNEFVVTLRDCAIDGTAKLTASEKLSSARSYLSQSLQKLREKGFLNYYGLQRFGTFSTRTDVVGVKILQGDFQGACDAILQFSPIALDAAKDPESSALVGQDDKNRAEGINIWRTTGKVPEALEKIPRKFSAETALIRHLGRQRQDFLGALLSIQRNLRLMYVHAYQSLVWNLAVGERWTLYGHAVVEGDLVLVNEHKEKEAGQEVVESVDADGEIVVQPSADDRAYDPDDIYERARALTAEEAASGQYSIFDVVLPLPGFDVIYPPNATGQWYQTFMASEAGGRLDPHNMRRKQRDFSLSGGYRKILARIGADYDFQVHEYTNDDMQFVATDMDKLKGKRGGEEAKEKLQPASSEETAEASADRDGDGDGTAVSEPASELEQKKLAAVLKFQLGASQYATMALRELSRGGIQAYKPEFMGGR
ncbi:tRNA pseudouridine38/39 synthase [Capronia epimyces CBS 606.96]|uniref:tRNA pseudouridine38/39 synthase n=1 Tax=Capronia epimyces CBS 606.96 TaxID=1182542 RepID=W9Y4N8_9EURO|nr:tRNA pseudouridine38/39 synthase [Capronia epimyces CBS 606.96]EXJ87463.1 tRNA pseudouridine38/39 synthase [Capronia epimyces CBS 606.96]